MLRGTILRLKDDSLKKIEELKKGEEVLGDDFTPRKILEISREARKMYTVRQYKEKTLWYEYNLKCLSSIVVSENTKLSLKNFKTGNIIQATAREIYNEDLVYQVEYGMYNNKNNQINKIYVLPHDIFERQEECYKIKCDGNNRFCLENYTIIG